MIDLGYSYKFDRISVFTTANGGTGTAYGMPRDFAIEVSNDGENFTAVVEKTAYPTREAGEHTFTFEAVHARYVRIRGTQLNQLPHESYVYRMQLAEVQVYNTPAADKSALTPLIEEYNAIDRSLYTTDSLLVLEEAMEAVVKIMENDALTANDQTEIDTAVTNLRNALNGLTYKPGMEPPADDPPAEDPPVETHEKDPVNVGAIVGGAIGGVAAVAIGVAVAVVLVKRKKK